MLLGQVDLSCQIAPARSLSREHYIIKPVQPESLILIRALSLSLLPTRINVGFFLLIFIILWTWNCCQRNVMLTFAVVAEAIVIRNYVILMNSGLA